MKIIDGGRTVEIPDSDPVVPKIRALLYAPQGAARPVQTLWSQASAPLREVLAVIAEHGEISQVEIERRLGITGIGLRGRTAALARIAKRIGVEYPVLQTGGRREFRQFSLAPDVADEIRLLARRTPRKGSKP